MKKSKMGKRIIAGSVGVLLIAGLVSLVISLYGNPFTHLMLSHKVGEYMEETFPNMTYSIEGRHYTSKFNTYEVTLLDMEKGKYFKVYYHKNNDTMQNDYHMDTCDHLNLYGYDVLSNTITQTENDGYYHLSMNCWDANFTEENPVFQPDKEENPVTLEYLEDEKELPRSISLEELKERIAKLDTICEKYNVRVSSYTIQYMEIPVDKTNDDAFLQERLAEHFVEAKE